MKQGRRAVLGMALLGGVGQVFGGSAKTSVAVPPAPYGELDTALTAISRAPALQLASMSVLAIRDGKIAYEFQTGMRSIGVHGAPSKAANERTLYRMASISKMMTTLGVMRLVEDGKLALDADAGDYLGYPLRNPHFPNQPITLRTLLNHTSTLRDDLGYSFPAATSLKSLLLAGGELYGNGAMWAPTAPPGRYFTYSNLNWGVIGTIMERVSGERFDRLMKRLLLDPMGLHGGYNPSEFSAEDLSNLATLYRKRTTDTEIWHSAGPWIAQVDDYSKRPPAKPAGIDSYVIGTNATPFSPTGGMRMSARGMGKVMLMLMNEGKHEGRQILRADTLATMFSRQWSFDGSNGDTDKGLFNYWGLGNQHFVDQPGMQMVEGGGFAGVGHLGEAYGLMSVFAADLAAKNGMIVLVGGVSSDPAAYKSKSSAMARFEEQILTAMHRHVIVGKEN
ncbi:serine hydrolase domain-containing protein [Massilia soli]|uniref:Beta-lactamase family protein n=1 Tax=Massilia soli TaxID=2792854 RepID=A0ABS7SJY4_9BURK|nr:serine hydrolase domain-containing protein [Massilia soli]MBZ2206322.1 beta-lactamase family protein [Massilia soli]